MEEGKRFYLPLDQTWSTISGWYTSNYEAIDGIFGLVLVIIIFGCLVAGLYQLWCRFWSWARPKESFYECRQLAAIWRSWRKAPEAARKARMARQKRRQHLLDKAGQLITDGFEDDVAKGKVTRAEANAIYREIGVKIGIKKLLPRKRSQREVKNSILHRLFWTNFYNKRIRFPDSKAEPPEAKRPPTAAERLKAKRAAEKAA